MKITLQDEIIVFYLFFCFVLFGVIDINSIVPVDEQKKKIIIRISHDVISSDSGVNLIE